MSSAQALLLRLSCRELARQNMGQEDQINKIIKSALTTCTCERKASVEFWLFPPANIYLWALNPESRYYWLISRLKHTSGKIKPRAPHKPLPLAPALCLPSYLSIHCYGRLVLLCLPAAKQSQVLPVPVRRLCQACLPRPVGKSFHHLQIQQPGL